MDGPKIRPAGVGNTPTLLCRSPPHIWDTGSLTSFSGAKRPCCFSPCVSCWSETRRGSPQQIIRPDKRLNRRCVGYGQCSRADPRHARCVRRWCVCVCVCKSVCVCVSVCVSESLSVDAASHCCVDSAPTSSFRDTMREKKFGHACYQISESRHARTQCALPCTRDTSQVAS